MTKPTSTVRSWRRGLALSLFLASAAMGQTTGRTVYDEQLRVALDRQMPTARETGFDAGGWINLAFFNYDDAAARRDRMLGQYEVRGWASFNHRGVHRAYVRGLLRYNDWSGSDNPNNGRSDEFDEEIERAWYQFDLGQLLYLQSGRRPAVGTSVRVGRDFDTIGTGLALSKTLDAVRMNTTTEYVDLDVLFGRTPHNSINIDPSTPVAHSEDRVIFGAQATGKVGQHRPFVYFLLNDDHTDDAGHASATQRYEYDSYYLGVGSQGSIFLPRLEYVVEGVCEWGDTYGNGATSGKDDIRAWAADVQLGYRFPGRWKPRVFSEYLFASGDNDRTGSSVATDGGNMIGTTDKAFNAFGFRDTGVAFAPEISNIHMIMVGGSFVPFPDCRLLENLELGTKTFFYQKAASSGATSDTTSTNDASWLGWEWDIYANWRITSDFAWTIRYGFFDPGAAFTISGNDGADNVRHFIFTGVVFSF